MGVFKNFIRTFKEFYKALTRVLKYVNLCKLDPSNFVSK